VLITQQLRKPEHQELLLSSLRIAMGRGLHEPDPLPRVADLSRSTFGLAVSRAEQFGNNRCPPNLAVAACRREGSAVGHGPSSPSTETMVGNGSRVALLTGYQRMICATIERKPFAPTCP